MKLKLITITFSLFLTNQLLAQYTGPGSNLVYKNVKDVLEKSVDGTYVVLEGHLKNQLNIEKYIFTDGFSEIRVEIDADKMPITSINEKTKIRIKGEVEKDFLESIEIDVDNVEIIK